MNWVLGSRCREGRGFRRELRARAALRRLVICLPAVPLMAMVLSLVAAPPAVASASTWYAYATAMTSGLTNCPQTTNAAQQYTLVEALFLVQPGGTVALATPGASASYVGNWGLTTPGTSSSQPETLEPAPGVANPTLDGNGGSSNACPTDPPCDGPLLYVAGGCLPTLTESQ